MQEDEWKVGQEYWKTKKRFSKEDMSLRQDENVINSEKEKKEEKQNDRKALLRELIDSVGSSIEEIKRRKQNGTPEFKKNKTIELENLSSNRYLREFMSGSKLGAIIEEDNEEIS